MDEFKVVAGAYVYNNKKYFKENKNEIKQRWQYVYCRVARFFKTATSSATNSNNK